MTDPRTSPSAVTIGTFDGVHRGHQALIQQTADSGLPVVAVTFDPHPVEVLAPEKAPLRLTTLERRVELLRAAGAAEVRILAFDREMASWLPTEFVDRVIVEQLSADLVVVGANFTFGARGAGTPQLLRDLGTARGYRVDVAELFGGDPPCSSTRVRAALAAGDLMTASNILGRLPELTGPVTHGAHRGRELGYPTANLIADEHFAIPLDGVYASWLVRATGERLPAATSIGTNPTFADTGRRAEAYVLDRDDLDLYGEQIRLEFVAQVRGMQKFVEIDELVEQMAVDVRQVRRVLGSDECDSLESAGR